MTFKNIITRIATWQEVKIFLGHLNSNQRFELLKSGKAYDLLHDADLLNNYSDAYIDLIYFDTDDNTLNIIIIEK